VIEDDPRNARSRRTRISRLAKALTAPDRRHAYMATQLKAFLSDQIRTLRGSLTQREFGDKIGKPQSVISRLEKQLGRYISIQTIIDIAVKLDIAVIIRFVDFSTFLRYTDDYSDNALAPRSYDQATIDALAEEEERRAQESVINTLIASNLLSSDQHGIGTVILQAGILPIPAQPTVSIDLVDESPGLTAAAQSAEIDIKRFLQLQQQRNAASGILQRNAVVGY
jgi:transcriptional regulator with XRE-family HTH domain